MKDTRMKNTQRMNWKAILALTLVLALGMVIMTLVVFVEQCQRRIPRSPPRLRPRGEQPMLGRRTLHFGQVAPHHPGGAPGALRGEKTCRTIGELRRFDPLHRLRNITRHHRMGLRPPASIQNDHGERHDDQHGRREHQLETLGCGHLRKVCGTNRLRTAVGGGTNRAGGAEAVAGGIERI